MTVGADKGYDTHDFVAECRSMNVVPHVAQVINEYRGSAIDARKTRHAGYAISQRLRKRVEEIFAWAKTVGGFRRTRFRGRKRTQLAAYVVAAAYNLVRIARLAQRVDAAWERGRILASQNGKSVAAADSEVVGDQHEGAKDCRFSAAC